MERRTLAGLSLLAAAALGSGALWLRAQEDTTTTVAAPRLGIGYYLRDARLSATGDDGHILYRIDAVDVVQSPADGSVALRAVSIDYDPATEVPWRLRADRGVMGPGDKMVRLSGNVVAATRDAASPVATISTDYLELDPGTETASTTSKVVIEYAGSIVHATGLRAQLREDRLELLADVRGRYER